jgi:SEC-C motif-containing protein
MSAWTDSRARAGSATTMSRAAGDSTQGAPAPTAESLMRSRYSAFAVGDAGYLLRTWHPSRRPRTLSLDPARRWTRLAVLETRDGGLFDAIGTVQFRAAYVQQGRRGVLAGDQQVRAARQALNLPRPH